MHAEQAGKKIEHFKMSGHTRVVDMSYIIEAQ